MSDPVARNTQSAGIMRDAESRLAATIREVKSAIADRDDVVVDIREAQLTRLELLADELKPVFADVPHDDDWFDFAISSGTQPRLWIDAVAHVTMARDQRTYRFLRDSRLGRVVMAETSDMKPVAEQVTRYIAERIVERQRAIAGDTVALMVRDPEPDVSIYAAPIESRAVSPVQERKSTGSRLLKGVLAIAIGGLVGVIAVLLYSGKLLEWLTAALSAG